jgi:hypothetical protein
MASNIDDEPLVSHAIGDRGVSFADTVLPSVGDDEQAQGHVAFHFCAMCVLQIAPAGHRGQIPVRRCRSPRKAHAVAIQ